MAKFKVGDIIGTDLGGYGYTLIINVIAEIITMDEYNYTYVITRHQRPDFIGHVVSYPIQDVDKDWILVNNEV